MLDYSDVLRACAFAAKAHGDQKRANGDPYIVHPLRVAMRVAMAGYGVEAAVVAALHDVVEDTDYTLDDIAERYGDEVAAAVDCLTKRDREKYAESIARVTGNQVAATVKMCDIEDNLSDLERAPFSEERKKRLYTRYRAALEVLEPLILTTYRR